VLLAVLKIIAIKRTLSLKETYLCPVKLYFPALVQISTLLAPKMLLMPNAKLKVSEWHKPDADATEAIQRDQVRTSLV